MGISTSGPGEAWLEGIRRQRANLRGSMSALELALAGPASRDQVRWAERVHVALVELSADFREHTVATEGAEGLYVDILATSPRLAAAVDRLTREHVQVNDHVVDLLGRTDTTRTGTTESPDVEKVRALGTALLGLLVGHRQRGSDVVYEAYEFDVGGET